MKFDRTAPGGGVEVICRLENGKAFLEWEFYFLAETDNDAESRNMQQKEALQPVATLETTGQEMVNTTMVRSDAADLGTAKPEGSRQQAGWEKLQLRLIDAQGNMAVACVQELDEEERLQSVLTHPQLWNSTQDPCLYTLEADIVDREGRCHDRFCGHLPLRSMEMHGAAGLFLNGQPFSPRMVAYSVQSAGKGADGQRRIFEDLKLLKELGANCICAENEEGLTKSFLQLCERFGFVILTGNTEYPAGLQISGMGCQYGLAAECQEPIPCFRGKSNSLFLPDSRHPTSLFYKLKARWSKEPFIYIVPESVKRLESGNYTALCYSNCSRVALYSDGILFEFKKGQAEFEFHEIPVKSPCIMLAAEGDGCSTALSIHKTLINRL